MLCWGYMGDIHGLYWVKLGTMRIVVVAGGGGSSGSRRKTRCSGGAIIM